MAGRITYHFSSPKEIGQHFAANAAKAEEQAKNPRITKREKADLQAQAATWRDAATMMEDTVITPARSDEV